MQKLLVKLFIKNYKDTNNAKVRGSYGTLSGIVGIISNLILCAGKIILGFFTASFSIMADGINNLTDAGSSIITLIGFKLSSAPADEDHPYGHERIEYITGLIISFLILLIGFNLGREAVMKIVTKDFTTTISILAIVIMCGSIAMKFWQHIFYKKMAKAINSEALYASSKDSLNDCISTTSVIIGMILIKFTNLPIIDPIISIMVAILIFSSGLKMVFETINPLIGIKATDEEIEMISNKIISYDGILGIHDLVIHRYGNSTVFVTAHAEVPSDVDVTISHDIIDNIERDFREELNIDLTIHLDPIDINNPETMRLKEMVNKIIKNIDEVLSIHDFRVVHGQTHTNLLFDITMPIKFSLTPSELRTKVTNEIRNISEHYFAIIQIDQLYNRKN